MASTLTLTATVLPPIRPGSTNFACPGADAAWLMWVEVTAPRAARPELIPIRVERVAGRLLAIRSLDRRAERRVAERAAVAAVAGLPE